MAEGWKKRHNVVDKLFVMDAVFNEKTPRFLVMKKRNQTLWMTMLSLMGMNFYME
jgi:hypothetical protein